MKIVVIGPGSLGCLFAAKLACPAKHELWLLHHDAEKAAAFGQNIILDEGGKIITCPVKITHQAEIIGPANLVLLCVKSNAVKAALLAAKPLFSEQTLLVTLQNGISHIRHLAAIDNHVSVAVGVTSQGANLSKPGHVIHAGEGMTRLGNLSNVKPIDPATELLQNGAKVLTEAGIETVIEQNILAHVWNKLLINAGINGLSAFYNCANGDLLTRPEARQRLVQIVKEAATVARAKSIPITEDPVGAAITVCQATSANISSMLQDVRNKRATEIDAINGAIIEEAKRLNIAVPENEKITRQIKEIEKGYLSNFP